MSISQMTFDDLLKQMVQTSRKQAPAVLYGGDLQDNTTLSFSEQKYEETPVVNKPAAGNKFSTYGSAITERDDRMFMMPQPQVPANPELEALNDYFNQRRLEQFARSSSAMIVGETIQKQAEQTASAIVKDEMDRRAGIRRAVLERTGLTPSQIQQQLVAESVAGVNPRALDMREQQITDAVALYYNINNIPQPVTTPMVNPVPSTVPSGTIEEAPAPEETVPEETVPEAPAPAPEEEIQAAPEEEMVSPMPEEPAAAPSYPTADRIMAMNKVQLIELIYNPTNPIRITDGTARIYGVPSTDLKRGEGRAAKGYFTGQVNQGAISVFMLRQAVLASITQGGAGAARGSNLNEPSGVPTEF
jgi:hypothetical protein